MNFRKPRSDKQYDSESERKAAWYQRNKERILAKSKKAAEQRTDEQRERINARARERLKDPAKKAKKAAAAKIYRQTNKAELLRKNKEYNKKNKDNEHFKKRNKRYRDKRRAGLIRWFYEYKLTLSCAHCGFNHPAALQFHHIDPKTKKFTISQELVMKRAGKKKILEEMAKCIVLCANCHFIEHFKGKRYGSTIGQSA